MPSIRRTLDSAHKEVNNEFYTQYEDIEREITHYIDFNNNVFKDKIVLCPCNDPEWSNFTIYFAQNFMKLGLKKLITVSYAPKAYYNGKIAPTKYIVNSKQFDETKEHVKGKVFSLEKNETCTNIDNLTWKYLDGDGDFRSDEVKKLRDEADIIVTNPPFSLTRDFIPWILEVNKKFLILGNQNTITFKNIYPLIKENKIWLGCRFNERVNGKNLTYRVPDFYTLDASEYEFDEMGNKYITVPGTGWFTNLDHGKRHTPLRLMTMDENIRYSSHSSVRRDGYPKYDNYDAIEVPFVDAIPCDYEGIMGVPITFLGKYCPEQFEIIQFRKGYDGRDLSVNGKDKYFRILIRRRKE